MAQEAAETATVAVVADGATTLSVEEVNKKYAKALDIINDVDGSYDEAIELLTDVLEFRCTKYGELAIECAPAFYNYGLALFNKARLENDVFGEPVQKAMVEKAIHQMKQQAEQDQKENKEDGSSAGAGAVEGEDVEDEAEDQEEDLEENDMELAWRNLETARLIYGKLDGYEKEIADVYAALAELSMEREDFETSISDFKSAISVLENSKSGGSVQRILAEYHYKLCIALQLYGSQQSQSGNKIGGSEILKNSISYCKKSLSILDNELVGLKSNKDSEDVEVKDLEGIMEEMQMKVEELTDSIALNSSAMAGSRAMGAPSSSSQLGFDKPKLNTSVVGSGKENSGGVSNLGVVGRGVKRVSLAPVKKVTSSPTEEANEVVKKQKL